jgi:hypothetical protein
MIEEVDAAAVHLDQDELPLPQRADEERTEG